MAAMALHVGKVIWVVSYMLTRVLLGKFGAKRDNGLVVVDNMKEVVEYKIICEENQGSEGKSLKADVLERSSLSFPSLNFSWGDVAHHPTCVVLAGLTSLDWNRRIAMDVLGWPAICSCGLDTWSCASQQTLG